MRTYVRILKKYFSLKSSISLRERECPFHYSHLFSEHEEAGRLQPLVGVKCIYVCMYIKCCLTAGAHTRICLRLFHWPR